MNDDFSFSVDRTSAVPLVQQVADGCRNAIATGDFPVGKMIPSLGAMAAGLGVSLKLVTVCNRGNEPCWTKDLSSLSHDQRRLGESVAELMADRIEGSRRPLKLDAAVEFVRGETF